MFYKHVYIKSQPILVYNVAPFYWAKSVKLISFILEE